MDTVGISQEKESVFIRRNEILGCRFGSTGRVPRLAILSMAVAAAFLVAGCGSDDDGGDSSGGGSGGSEDAAAALKPLLEGTSTEPPRESPPAAANKNIWVISCGQAEVDCARPAEAAVEAAEKLGWEATLYDGELDPNVWSSGIRQAVANNADAVFIYNDCDLVSSALKDAKAAGVRVVVSEGDKCEGLADWVVTYGDDNISVPQFLRDFGAAQATWLTTATDDGTKLINFNYTDFPIIPNYIEPALEETITKYGGEVVDTVQIVSADFGPKVQQKTSQALLKNPDANAVTVATDAFITGGIGAGVQSAGRDVAVMGGACSNANLDLIREGSPQQDACVAISQEWEGYAAMDALNRLFNGEEPVTSGIGLQVIDESNVESLPPGPYEPSIDFRAAYEEAWGVSGSG